MGSSYLDGNELRTRALNWSDSLASRSRESVRIGTLHEGRVLIVHHVFRPDDSLQVLDVGTLLPVHATALGKALLAESPYVASVLAGLEPFTPATVTDPDALRGATRGDARAGLGGGGRGADRGRGVLRRRDQGPARRAGRRDRHLRAGRAAPRCRRAVGRSWSPTCARRRARYRATSGRSPGDVRLAPQSSSSTQSWVRSTVFFHLR